LAVPENPTPLNMHDPAAIAARRPLLIAHRGGVIAPDAPENSKNAIALAAQQGYDMVELDVRRAKDGEPVLFHGFGRHGSLLIDCETPHEVHELTSAELTALRYRGTDQPLLTLDQGLALCATHGLGVMLDLKGAGGDALPVDFLQRIADRLDAHGLLDATITITGKPEVRNVFGARILHRVTDADGQQVRTGARSALDGLFWFGGPEEITDPELAWYKENGALVIPCINSFRYPNHSFGRLEQADIGRLQAQHVDGFQIDSVYGELFDKLARKQAWIS